MNIVVDGYQRRLHISDVLLLVDMDPSTTPSPPTPTHPSLFLSHCWGSFLWLVGAHHWDEMKWLETQVCVGRHGLSDLLVDCCDIARGRCGCRLTVACSLTNFNLPTNFAPCLSLVPTNFARSLGEKGWHSNHVFCGVLIDEFLAITPQKQSNNSSTSIHAITYSYSSETIS